MKKFYILSIGIIFLISTCASSVQAASTVKQITQNVRNFEASYKRSGHFEVTVWDMNANILSKDTTPPYEVIVNGNFSKDRECFDAKYSLFEIMKRLYTDSSLKNKIARVKVTIPYQLRASLGSEDAAGLNWNNFKHSLFWRTLLKYKSYEWESGPLSQRTYGVKINQACYK